MLTDGSTSNLRPRPMLLLRSTLAPWRDILKIYQYRVPPPFDFPERSYSKHVINEHPRAITDSCNRRCASDANSWVRGSVDSLE